MAEMLFRERSERMAEIRLFAEILGAGMRIQPDVISANLQLHALEIFRLKYNSELADPVKREAYELLGKHGIFIEEEEDD